MKKVLCLIVVPILICGGDAYSTAHPTVLALALPSLQARNALRSYPLKAKSFVAPNEPNPSDALPIWKKTTSGVYISVGTERGFIGAAFSGATQLLLLDFDPTVVRFNRLLILLLKACAGDMAAYMGARKDANSGEALARNAKTLTPEEKAALLAGVHSEQWQDWQRMFRSTHFLSISQKEYLNDYKGPFHDAHYALDKTAFRKLTKMALAGAIQAEYFDFSSAQQVDELIAAMVTSDLTISVLDLSNAWERGYISPLRTQRLIGRLGSRAKPESLVLLTSVSHIDGVEWHYHANTFAELTTNGYLQANIPANDDGDYYIDEFFQLIHGSLQNLTCSSSLKSRARVNTH